MPSFQFAPNKSPEECVEDFLKHLETLDPECAAILRANLAKLSPLPEGTQRTRLRQQVNEAILKAIEALPDKAKA